jgi:hypothetical protein
VRYVLKYVTKPLDKSIFGDVRNLDIALAALRGRRTLITHGDWRGLCPTVKASVLNWDNLGTLDSILAQAAAGDDAMVALVHSVMPGAADVMIGYAAVRYRVSDRPPRALALTGDQLPLYPTGTVGLARCRYY